MHLRIAPLLAALGILAATWAAPPAAAGDDALLTAARTGDLAGTRARLEKGADPNDYVKERSPLQAAAQLGWEEVVDLLLSRGAKPDLRDGTGDTALHRASEGAQPKIVRKLLEAGATVDAENDYRMTPLFRASRAGSAEAVRLLLEHGADPRHVDHTGAGPLSEAALSRSRACVALLIEHGAPVGGADTVMRWTPLHLAAQLGYRDVAEVLVDAGGPLDALDADGRTPLGEAAAHGHAGLVLLMLPHGVDPDLAAPGHATPFVEAADGGHEDVVRALLDKTKALDPALVAAAGAGFEDVVARLLGRGAQAGATDAKGASALERAAGSGHLAIVRRLVAAGVDLGRCGGRALGAAAEAGCLEIVAFLLDAKVPVDARGADDPTALMRAAGSGWEAVVRLLLDRGADRKATSARGGDIEAAMAASEKAISARLEALRASRAWHPEEEQLPGELRELQASHERIRKLLAR